MDKTPQKRNSAAEYTYQNDGTKRRNVSKREIWNSLDGDTKEFLSAWPKGAIVELTNITKQLTWRK